MEDKITLLIHLLDDRGVTRKKLAGRHNVSYSALSKMLAGQLPYRLSEAKVDEMVAYLEAVNTNEV